MKTTATEQENLKTTQNYPSFKVWLQNEFIKRTKRNPSYSLRAFSQLLKTEPTSISQILSGKRKASAKVITQIGETLSANPSLLSHFIAQSKAKFKKSNYHIDNSSYNEELITADAFSVISDWYHIALLELVNVDGFNADPKWIAEQLFISATEAQIAMDRLLRLGLVAKEDSKFVRTNKMFTNFSPGMTSSAHKSFQKQILQLALEAIDNTPQEEKDITAITMAIDVDKMPEAKKMIHKFRHDFCTFVEDGHQTRVYELAIQFYPLSKNNNKQGVLK